MKEYLEPEIKVVYIDPLDIIASSTDPTDPTDPEDGDNTTGTIPLVPWG